jgi:hypothetical protein
MDAAGQAGGQGLFSRLSRRGGNYSSKLWRQGEGMERSIACREIRLEFSGTCFALMGTTDSVWLFIGTIVTLLVHFDLLSAPSWCK